MTPTRCTSRGRTPATRSWSPPPGRRAIRSTSRTPLPWSRDRSCAAAAPARWRRRSRTWSGSTPAQARTTARACRTSACGGSRSSTPCSSPSTACRWADRTATDVARGGATLGWGLGRGRMTLELTGYRDRQDWGTPLPYEAGAPVPGFDPDRNYAVGGAEVRHQVLAATSHWTLPLRSGRRIENTLGFTHDDQRLARSFPGELAGDTPEAQGVELEPRETA